MKLWLVKKIDIGPGISLNLVVRPYTYQALKLIITILLMEILGRVLAKNGDQFFHNNLIFYLNVKKDTSS